MPSKCQPLKIGDYMLTNFIKDTECGMDTPGLFCKSHSVKKFVDKESLLIGITHDDEKYTLSTPEELHQHYIEPKKYNSNSMIIGESTKTGRACSVLSGVNIDRFNILPTDVQSVVDENTKIGQNSRLYAKDCQVSRNGAQLKLKPQYGNTCE
jgi:NDP-sugar pyrophosphorylase family protein